MLVPKYYEDLTTLHLNTMPNRAYYIPASASMNTAGEKRNCSDRFVLLNGNWKFRYYESIYDLKEKFFEEGFPAADFGEIPVPGVWQNYGYDRISTATSVIRFLWTALRAPGQSVRRIYSPV